MYHLHLTNINLNPIVFYKLLIHINQHPDCDYRMLSNQLSKEYSYYVGHFYADREAMEYCNILVPSESNMASTTNLIDEFLTYKPTPEQLRKLCDNLVNFHLNSAT